MTVRLRSSEECVSDVRQILKTLSETFLQRTSFLAIAALSTVPSPAAAHTDSLGWLLSDDPVNNGRYVVEIFYGSWHAGNIAAEGSLRLQGAGGLTFDETQPFAIVPGFVNVANGTRPPGLTLGQNYFFPDRTTGEPDDFTDDPTGRSIFGFQSAEFDNLQIGEYNFGYDATGGLTANWTPSDTAINAGTFTIGAGGTIVVPGATPIPDIDTTQDEYSIEDLNGSLVNPVFTGGTLTVGNSGNVTANFTVNNTNGSINTNSNTTTFSGNFSGAGQITKVGGGTLRLIGNNTNAGGFRVNEGTLAVNNGNALGNGPLTFNGGAFMPLSNLTLGNNIVIQNGGGTINTPSSLTFTGGLTGTGNLVKTGSGPLSFNGVNNLIGEFEVQEGLLQVPGSFAVTGGLEIGNGATLGGTGFINTQNGFTYSGQVFIGPMGTLAPGASPGTLTVGTDVTLAPGATFLVEIDGYGTGNGAGNYDRLILTGDAAFTADGTIEPRIRGISAPATNSFTPQIGDRFTVVQAAGGVQGTFDQIDQMELGITDETRFDVIYGSQAITLIVVSASLEEAALLFSTGNAAAVGAAFDQIKPPSGDTPAEADTLFTNLINVPRVQTATLLGQLAGGIYAMAGHSGRESSRLLRDGSISTLIRTETKPETIEPRTTASLPYSNDGSALSLKDRDEDLSEQASFGIFGTALDRALRPHGGWVSAVGKNSRYSASPVDYGFRSNYYGLVGGFHLVEESGYRVGIGAGHLRGDVDAAISDEADLHTTSFFGYGQYHLGPVAITSSIGVSYSDYDVEREISFPSSTVSLAGDFESYLLHSDTEARLPIPLTPRFTLSPIAGLRSEFGWVDDFQEEGSALVALSGDNAQISSTQVRLGSELMSRFELEGQPGRAWIGGSWLIEAGPNRIMEAELALHGVSWNVATPADDRHSLLLQAGLSVELPENWHLMADYGATLSNDSEQHHLFARIQSRW